MGFLDFLKKNKPAPAPQPDVAPPVHPDAGFGSATLDDAPPAPDAFLSDLSEHHDPADDLFSPSPKPAEAPKPAAAPAVAQHETKSRIPDDLFAPPAKPAPDTPPAPKPAPAQPAAVDMQKAASLMTAVQRPAAAASHSPVADIPDFSDEDIAALEHLGQTAVPSVIGMDMPSVAAAPAPKPAPSPAPVAAPAPKPMPVAQPTREPQHETPAHHALMDADGFLSAQDYLTITDDVRASRRAIRRSDDALRDAVSRHEQLDAQYARAASDITNIDERLRALDVALFGE